ncbi:unnamed protein product [Phaeothamnion confervicola]
MSEQQWVSVSALGDPWEVEMNMNAEPDSRFRYRYRSAMFGRIRTEWEPGRPPTGVHAAKDTPGPNGE